MANSPLTTTNTVPLKGVMCVSVRNVKTGQVLRRFEIRNTITYQALTAMVRLIADAAFAGSPNRGDGLLAYIKPGGGVTGSAPSPTAPTRNDTDTENPFVVGMADYVTAVTCDTTTTSGTGVDDGFFVTVTASIPSTDLNGMTLNEAGLFLGNGWLFARQLHPAINKDSGLAVDYDWRISFTS